MKIGEINNLEVVRIVSPGAILKDADNQEVLLPGKFIPENLAIGDIIDVFVYTDSEDRVVATTQTPIVLPGDVAVLEVVDVTPFGAFVNWGLDKDLLITHKNQKSELSVGDKCLVLPFFDEHSNRLCGTTKLGFVFNNDVVEFVEGDMVEAIVYSKTTLGYNVVLNKKNWGLLYKNEIFQPINIGDTLQVMVKKIRHDNKIDVVLQKSGREQADDVSSLLLEFLQANGGKINLTDKSSPDDIYAFLKVSKRNFKQAVGNLYKQRKIKINDDNIELI